jgi:hypothetical protein
MGGAYIWVASSDSPDLRFACMRSTKVSDNTPRALPTLALVQRMVTVTDCLRTAVVPGVPGLSIACASSRYIHLEPFPFAVLALTPREAVFTVAGTTAPLTTAHAKRRRITGITLRLCRFGRCGYAGKSNVLCTCRPGQSASLAGLTHSSVRIVAYYAGGISNQ